MANKEGKNKAFEEIERLVNEQSGKDKKTKKDEAKLKKETERQAKEQAKKEAEEAKKAKKEAEKLAKEKAKKEAEEAKRAKKETAKLAKEQKAQKGPAPEPSSANYQGNFQLVLPVSAGFKQVRQFSESLAGLADLKVIWTGGSADEGALIAISVAEPVPLARILSDMPMVEGVEVKGDKINVTLKTSA